jgi:hypothetical protein
MHFLKEQERSQASFLPYLSKLWINFSVDPIAVVIIGRLLTSTYRSTQSRQSDAAPELLLSLTRGAWLHEYESGGAKPLTKRQGIQYHRIARQLWEPSNE